MLKEIKEKIIQTELTKEEIEEIKKPISIKMFGPEFESNKEYKPYINKLEISEEIIDNEVEIWGYGKMPVEDVKLVLRPLSSISKQEIKELEILLDRTFNFWFNETEVIPYIDFLISHHFDYRGLIDMGLAIIDENDIYSKL